MQDHKISMLEKPILDYDLNESLIEEIVIDTDLSDYPTIKFKEFECKDMKISLSGDEMYQIYDNVLNIKYVNIMSDINYISINDSMISLVNKLINNHDFCDESKKFIAGIYNHINLLGKYEYWLGKLNTVCECEKKERLNIF